MKKIILVFAVIAITAGAYAQNDSTNRDMSPSDINNTNDGFNQNRDINNNQSQFGQDNPTNSHPDGVMMQNGSILLVKNGQVTLLNRDLTLSNGTKVTTEGSYTKKDGTKLWLREGQHIDMSGNIIPMQTDNKNKNMYLVPDSTIVQ